MESCKLTLNLDIIKTQYYDILTSPDRSVDKVKSALSTLLKKGYDVEDIVKMVKETPRRLKGTNQEILSFIKDEKTVRDFLSSPKVINNPLPVVIKSKELAIDNPNAIVQNGKRARIWLSESWGTASLAKNKFILATNREIQSRILGMIKTSGPNEDAEIILNSTILRYFEYNLNWLKDFFNRIGKHDYAKLIEDNMPFEGANPNFRINYIINSISDYFSEYTDSEKMAYVDPRNSSYDRAQAFAKFLLIQPLNFDNFLASNINSILIRNKGKLVHDINKYGIQLGKGRLNMTWQDEDAVYSIAKMVDDFVQREVESWNLYRKLGNTWIRQNDEFCETGKVVSVLTKILKTADLNSPEFEPIVYNSETEAMINELKNTFRIAFGVNVETNEEVIETVFERYIRNKTIPEIIKNINQDPHHLLPIIMYLLTQQNNSSKKSIVETSAFKDGIVKLNNNEVNILYSIWLNMFNPMNNNSLYNQVSQNKEFDLYQMISQVMLTHDKKELYGIVNDMGKVEKKNYSLGRANLRLNQLQSKINGSYSPLLSKPIYNTTIEDDFESDLPTTTITFKVPFKQEYYTIKVTKGRKAILTKNGSQISGTYNILQALKDLSAFFEKVIKVDFTNGNLFDIYINKLGGGFLKSLESLMDIAGNLIYASEVSKYLKGESTSDFKDKLKLFYTSIPKLVKGVTYNQVDAFSGRLFPKLSELSLANDINEGIIGDIVVKGGAGEQINSVILRTLTTLFSQFVEEKSLDKDSAIKHFSIRDAFKRMTFLRDYVDKTGDVKSSTAMNVEEFFLNSFIYDFYGDSLAVHLGVLSDKPNIPKMELYVDTEILIDPINGVVKKLKDCTADDLKQVAVRELGVYYHKMKLEMDRNLGILTQYSEIAKIDPNFKYDINTDYLETRAYSKQLLEEDIHNAIYRAQQAGEDIEINDLLYFSWDKEVLHTKPSLIAELRKHDIAVNTFGLQTENSQLFFNRKEHELVMNLLQDLKHGISFIDSQSLKVIDSSAVKAMKEANKDWRTKNHIIIGRILYGDSSRNLITKKSLTEWKVYKDFMNFAKDVAGTEFDLTRLNVNGNFDFLYFFNLLNNNWDRIQEYTAIESLKRKLEKEVRSKLSSPRIPINKQLLTEQYRQWRIDNIEETEVELNQAVINYETEPDENVWIRRNKAFLTEGIKDITSLEEIETYKLRFGLNNFDTTIKKSNLTFSLQINPELSRYNTLHYLYSEEGLNSTVGSHINHKVKYDTNLSLIGALETGQQAKRNVSESGAKNQYTRGDIEGVGKTMNIAVVKDVKAGISTINGVEDSKGATVMDGSTVGNYVTRKEELHSLGSQKAGIENSKPLGDDLNAKTGTGVIIKTAVFVLTNGRIRASERNIIMHKHMNSISWDPNFNGDYLHDFDGKEIKYHPVIVYSPATNSYYLRTDFKINLDGTTSFEQLEINNEVLSAQVDWKLTLGDIIKSGKDITPYINTIAAIVKPKAIGNKITTTITTTRPIRNNYELWDLFGGAYSASINDLNQLTYEDDNTSLENLTIACHNVGTRINKDVTRPTEQDVYLPLKQAKIDWIVTEGAIKQGASNINSTKMFDDINYKVTTQKIATADIGMLLNPEHLVDKSHITLMTQVVNALGLRGFSADAANKVYKALATLTDTSLSDLFEGIELRRSQGDDTKFKDAVASLLLKSIIGTSETDGDLIASIVVQLNKLDRNGHDYDVIRHRLPISDPAILNKLISNFSSLMTKAGVRIQFPGSMNVLVPSDGIYRIHGGKLRKFASTLRYKDSEVSKTLRSIINDKGYAIVWAHPGIGKSYSVEQGLFNDRIIDWDVEYNRIRDLWIAEHSNTKIGTKKFNEAKRKYLTNYQNYPDYILFLTENWERVKLKAKLEKKILVASPHALLKIFSNDFDEIINLPDSIFIERNILRGGTPEDSINLKSDLNTTINSLNNPNLVSTDLYLEEILNDTFNSGNLIENNEAEVEQQKLQELQAQQQPLDGLHAITIGASYFITLNTERYIEPWDDLSAKILSGESVKIDDLSTYYKVRDLLKGINYTIVEDVISGRELAPYNCTFNTDKGTYMLWDLDSIKHIHMIENDPVLVSNIYNNYSNEEIAREFHINPDNLDRTDEKTFKDSFKKLINRRKLIELNSIGSGNENDIFIDGLRVKIDKSSLKSFPYELIAPKNYETDFGLRVGDDVSEISKDKLFFLKRMLRTLYKLDQSGHWADQTPITSDLYDIILKTVSGKNYPILYKTPNTKIPDGLLKISELDFYANLDWDGSKVYRLDENGNRLYELPYHLDSNKKIVYDCEILVDSIGNEVIFTDNINFFVNKLHFNNIDFGRHIIKIPFIYDVFAQLKNCKKKSVNKLFNNYIGQLEESKQIFALESKINKAQQENKNIEKLNTQLVSITQGNEVNTQLQNSINQYFDLRDRALSSLNAELLNGEINLTYPPIFLQMIESSIETHTSFIKSLDYIVSRTPAQSHQSFMPMKLVAFDESGKNSAYVNRYLLYLLGSDFDVDKASLLGSIMHNGRYVKWSPFMSLKSIEHLRASETLPFPTNKKLVVTNNLNTRIYDAMDKPIHIIWHDVDRVTFLLPNVNFDIHLFKRNDGIYDTDLTPDKIESLRPMERYILERAIVDKIPEGERFAYNIPHLGIVNGVKDSSKYEYGTDFDQFIECFLPQFTLDENGEYQFNEISDSSLTEEEVKNIELDNIKLLGVLLNALNNFGLIPSLTLSKEENSFLRAILRIVDEHNMYFEDSSNAKDAVVNYISSNMFLISSDPVNLVLAMTSVDQLTEYIKKEIANTSPLAEQSKHFDKGNIMSIFRLLRLTLSGKQNTGIEASSLKVMEAINLYQDIILNYGSDEEQKSLIKPIEIGGHQLKLICNAYCKNIANIKSKEIYDALLEINNDEDQAIWLSAFLSLSTDNAKDPTLAKINANPEMIGLYNAGFVLGLPIDFLSKIIMSPVGMTIGEIQQGNVFLGYSGNRNISTVIDYIKNGPRLNPNNTTLKILSKAIKAQYGENVEVNTYNLAKSVMPGHYWDKSSLLRARQIIGLAKSLAYGKEGEEIKYNLPTVQSRLNKDILSTKTRISGTRKALEALNETISQKEQENRGHKREDKKLTSLTAHLTELEDRLSTLLDIRNTYESTFKLPERTDNLVYIEYNEYSKNLESLEKGELSEILKRTFEDYKDFIKNSNNFKKTILDLENWLDSLENVQLDEGYYDEFGKRHNTLNILSQLNEFASEMSLIRPNLALNQQLPNSKETQLAYIKKFENVINDRLTQSEIKESEDLTTFEQINESKGIPGLNINISEFIWDEDYRKAAIKAYDSIKFKVNVLDVILKVPHYFGYLKACDALYESLKFQSVLYREQDRILEKVIIEDLGIKASKDIQLRLKMSARYVSRQINNMFLLSKNVELNISKITDGKVNDSEKVPIKLGTLEGNKAFKEWMDLVIIPKCKSLYGSNPFFKELSEATYHKSDNHNTVINYTTGIDTMTSNPTENTKFAEVTEGFNKLSSKSIDGLPLIDAFFYYDLIAYDRLPGQQSLTPIFNTLVALGNTSVIQDYVQFVSDLDQGGNYILTLDNSQINEIKRFIAPVISIYSLDTFNEEYGWVKDPSDQQYYLIERTSKPGKSNSDMMEEMLENDEFNEDILGLGPDGDINQLDERGDETYKTIDLSSKLDDIEWEPGKPKYTIVSEAGNLNNPYMDNFSDVEFQSILEGQGIISSKELRLGNETVYLDGSGKPVISQSAKNILEKITGLSKVDDLIVTKTRIDKYGLSIVIDIDTTKGNLENSCK